MAVKKSALRSASAKADAPPGAQSATARRAAETKLRELTARFAPEHLRLIGAMRRRLRERLPAAHEVVYEYRDWFVISFSPSERGYEGILAIRASADGVKLYFTRGKDVHDPSKLLHGTAQTRWISVEHAAVLSRPGVAGLIDQAIALNPTKLARTGGGSVIIRPASARRRDPE